MLRILIAIFILSRSKTVPFIARIDLTAKVFRPLEPRALALAGSILILLLGFDLVLAEDYGYNFDYNSPPKIQINVNVNQPNTSYSVNTSTDQAMQTYDSAIAFRNSFKNSLPEVHYQGPSVANPVVLPKINYPQMNQNLEDQATKYQELKQAFMDNLINNNSAQPLPPPSSYELPETQVQDK